MTKSATERSSHRITRFNPKSVKAIENTRYTAMQAQANAMNEIAQTVVDNGGYCDELTFSAAFFGGIDPEMNWDDKLTNQRLAGEIPDEFRRAQKLAHTALYSCHEPFVAMDSGFADRKYDLGIVMPGTEQYGSTAVGYRISQTESWRLQNHSFIGEMVFKGYSAVRSYRPYDDHSLFNVVRHKESIEAKCHLDRHIKFGMAAVREHVFPGNWGALSNKEMDDIYNYVEDLRAKANQHIKT